MSKRSGWRLLKLNGDANDRLHSMVRRGDGEPEAGQSCGLRDNLGLSGDWQVAVIVRAPDNQHPTTNIQQPTSNNHHPTTNIQQPTSYIQEPNIEHRTSNSLASGRANSVPLLGGVKGGLGFSPAPSPVASPPPPCRSPQTICRRESGRCAGNASPGRSCAGR